MSNKNSENIDPTQQGGDDIKESLEKGSTEDEEFPIELQAPPPEEKDEGMPEAPASMFLYTILMLLLMTFFIVLVSMGTSEADKFEKGMRSVRSNMEIMGLGGSKQSLLFLYSVLKLQNATIKNALELHDPSLVSGQSGSMDETEDEEEDTDKKKGFSKTTIKKLTRFVSLGYNVKLSKTKDKYLIIKLPYKKVFKSGTSETEPIFMDSLEPFLNEIGTDYSKMLVNVYSCEKPVENLGFDTSLELSILRAQKLASLFREIQGVGKDKITAVGYGSYIYDYDPKLIPEDKKELVELRIYSPKSLGKKIKPYMTQPSEGQKLEEPIEQKGPVI